MKIDYYNCVELSETGINKIRRKKNWIYIAKRYGAEPYIPYPHSGMNMRG